MTGASCSTSSGIPDYRDADGQWKRTQPVTFQAFMAEAAVRRRYWARSLLGWRRFSRAEPNAPRAAYFGADTALYAQRSALPGLIDGNIPFMISSAELDPPAMVKQFALLKEAMCKSERGCMRSVVLPQHSHMSESYAINTADTQLTNEILEFMAKGR